MLPSIITSVREILDGAAQDVFYALHFRGALESGDLPSKEGMTSLICLGLAVTDSREAEPHSLSTVGRIMAQEYYSAQAAMVERIAGQPGFLMRDLRPLVEHSIVRWMSTQVKSEDFLAMFKDSQMFHLVKIENNPAYVGHTYVSAVAEGTEPVKFDMDTGDRGTDFFVHVPVR